MKRAPRSRQRHDLYAKYHDYDSEISDLLGECGVILDGALDRMKREHNDRAWTVWHTAYLTAYAPQKSRSFTRLKALLWRDSSSEKQKPDWKAQFSAFSAWAGSFKRK